MTTMCTYSQKKIVNTNKIEDIVETRKDLSFGTGHVAESSEPLHLEIELFAREKLKYCGLHHAREWTSDEKRLVEIDYQIGRARGTTTTDVTTESNNSEDKLKA